MPEWNADYNMRINCIKMYEITSLKGVREKVLRQVTLGVSEGSKQKEALIFS